MKRYFLISITCFLLMLVGTSCKFLDYRPDDYLTEDMVFNDQIRTQDWLASVYSSVPDPIWGYDRDGEGWNVMGDDMTIPQEWGQFGWGEEYAFTLGNWNPSSPWNASYWTELPKRIRTGLIFLRDVKVLPNTDQTPEEVESMKAQARFLIAYYYALMVEVYGPIPFKPGVIEPVNAPASELMLTQSPVDEIVDWVEKELKTVAESGALPPYYSSETDLGKATSIMALAERAKLLLFAASPLFNGNADLQGWKNSNGEYLFAQGAPSTAKWAKAAQAHRELIDAAHAAGYELYKEYNTDGTIDPFMSFHNVTIKTRKENNKEVIFVRPHSANAFANPPGDLGWWQYHRLPRSIGGNAAMECTQELVDAFFMENGQSPILSYNPDGSPVINTASGYTETGFSDADDKRNTGWNLASTIGMVTPKGTHNMYCHREPRFYCTVIYNGGYTGGVTNKTTNYLKNGADWGPTFDAPHVGYNVRKRISKDVYPTMNKWVFQMGILYRLAEAYLGYAEALNESDPGNPDILTYINRVRERAGIPGLPTGLSQEEIRMAIRRERRVEFSHEGVRFNDIRRWKIGEETLNVNMYGMNMQGTNKSDNPNDPLAYYKRTFYRKRVFDKKQYLFPVPQTQMDINPNLVQNPLY